MKIAIHQPRGSYFLGGSEVISIELGKYLSKNHEVYFVTSKNYPQTENFKKFMKEYKKIKFIFVNSPTFKNLENHKNLSSIDIESIIFNENANEFYNKEKFDLVIAHYSTDILNLKIKKSKIILHLHGYPRIKKEIDNISYNKADALIYCSKHVKREMNKMFPKIPKDKFFGFYHIPDLNKFKEKNVCKDIDLLYVGRLTERKGLSLLVDSLKRIEFSNCIIAGDGPEKQKLEMKIKRLNLSKKIKLIGPVQKDNVIELIARAKIFVHPTIEREPFPTTLIESLAIGTPVISTKVGGIPEIIDSGKNGLLVKPNKNELFKAIKFILSHPLEREKYRINGLKMIKSRFNIQNKEEEYNNLIKEIYEQCIK